MWLTVDIGNSTIKCGLFDGSRLVDYRAWPTNEHAISPLLTWIDGCSVVRTGICSVVPAMTELFRSVLNAESLLQIEPSLDLPIHVDYERPELLGSDRVAAAIAAWTQFGPSGSILIVDAGTTATIDLVHNSTFLGGTIAAGPSILMKALANQTAALPSVPLEMPKGPYGQSTRTALQHGVMHGFVDTVQAAIERTSSALPSPPVVVATGGWSALLAQHIPMIHHTSPHLVLDGIREIMQRN